MRIHTVLHNLMFKQLKIPSFAPHCLCYQLPNSMLTDSGENVSASVQKVWRRRRRRRLVSTRKTSARGPSSALLANQSHWVGGLSGTKARAKAFLEALEKRKQARKAIKGGRRDGR